MDTETQSPSLDDVLDYYLLSSEETGKDTLAEMIKSYPQYEYDLRELSAFRKLGETVSGPDLTQEQEATLNNRAVGVVQDLLQRVR